MTITINGRNNRPYRAEPPVSFLQALLSGAALVLFVVGGLAVMVGAT